MLNTLMILGFVAFILYMVEKETGVISKLWDITKKVVRKLAK